MNEYGNQNIDVVMLMEKVAEHLPIVCAKTVFHIELQDVLLSSCRELL